jgi:hypothetical protein
MNGRKLNDVGIISGNFYFQHARVAKSADAKDLKSFFRQRECGFKSHPGHQAIVRIAADLLHSQCDDGVNGGGAARRNITGCGCSSE